MRILSLLSENVKRIRVVKFKPEANMVEIVGDNDQGKTSLLDSIWLAIDAAQAAKDNTKIVRTGENMALIRLELGDTKTELTIERQFFPDRPSKIRVYDAAGGMQGKPQTYLDTLIGALSFDPLAFIKKKPEDQCALLAQLVKFDVNLDQLERLNKADFDRRTDIGRELKSLLAQADGVVPPLDLPEKQIDTAILTDELMAASDFNTKLERRRDARASATTRIAAIPAEIAKIDSDLHVNVENMLKSKDTELARIDGEIADLEQRISSRRDRRQELVVKAVDLEMEMKDYAAEKTAALTVEQAELQGKLDKAAPLAEPKDPAAIRDQITKAETTNDGIRKRDRKLELLRLAAEKRTEYEVLTGQIDARDEVRAKSVREAIMPIEGLAFGSNQVLFNGEPLSQAAHAMQIRVSIAIAMALNPTIRVIRIMDAATLDKKSWQAIAEIAAEKDFQIWLEELEARGPAAIEIVDGEIKQ